MRKTDEFVFNIIMLEVFQYAIYMLQQEALNCLCCFCVVFFQLHLQRVLSMMIFLIFCPKYSRKFSELHFVTILKQQYPQKPNNLPENGYYRVICMQFSEKSSHFASVEAFQFLFSLALSILTRQRASNATKKS